MTHLYRVLNEEDFQELMKMKKAVAEARKDPRNKNGFGIVKRGATPGPSIGGPQRIIRMYK